MSSTVNLLVRKTVTVNAPQEHAFRVFTEGMGTWWPMDSHHTGDQPAVDVVVEPRAGGRWYELAADGSEDQWGRVLAWDPSDRVVLAWHLSMSFEFDPEPDRATEVEVRFIPEGPSRTRVKLEHRQLERFGDKSEDMRAVFDGPGGWGQVLAHFEEAAAA